MNRSDFLNMIEDSSHVNRQMLGEVYELIDIFPYFQSAHMLLLKGLQNNADVKFGNQLKNSSIHIADREVLYYFLQAKPLQKEAAEETITEKGSLPEPSYETVSSYDHQQNVIESAKNSEQLISEIETGDTGFSTKTEGSHFPAGHSILISSAIDDEDSSIVMMVGDDEPSTEEERVVYMDPGFSMPEPIDLLEIDLNDKNYNRTADDSQKEELQSAGEKLKSKQSQSDLIDKFIIANPRIEPAKDKVTRPVEDISRSFVEEDGSFVTETLAKIYTNQGYYSKAIDIYEKLSLKFPEKSSYFASQIEKVKEHIKK